MSDLTSVPESGPPRRTSRAPVVLGLLFALAAGAGIGGAVGSAVASDDGADDLEQRLSEVEAQRDDLARRLDEARAAAEQAPADEPSSVPEEPDEEPLAEEPSEEPAAEAPDGTRDRPFPVGTQVGNDDWEIVVGQPREAWAEIQAENEFNEPPPDGMEFYLLPVTATYTGDESAHAWADLAFQFVGSDNVTYFDYCGVIPNDLSDVGELYAGGVAEGNVCVVVPAGADGLWTVSTLFGEPLFLTAATAATGT